MTSSNPIKSSLAVLLVCTLMTLSGCDQSGQSTPTTSSASKGTLTRSEQQSLDQYSQTVAALWHRIAQSTQRFQQSVHTFLQTPNNQNLKSVRALFQKVVQNYLYATAFNSGVSPSAQVHARQFYPGYTKSEFIMGDPQYPNTGIIQDLAFAMELKALSQQQAMAWHGENTLGLQAIEILLYHPKTSINDYQPIYKWHDKSVRLPIREHPNNRQRKYLKLLARQLHLNALTLSKAWRKNEPDYLKEHASASIYRELLQQPALALDSVTQTDIGNEADPLGLANIGRYSKTYKSTLKPVGISASLALYLDIKGLGKSPKLLEHSNYPTAKQEEVIKKLQAFHKTPNKATLLSIANTLKQQ